MTGNLKYNKTEEEKMMRIKGRKPHRTLFPWQLYCVITMPVHVCTWDEAEHRYLQIQVGGHTSSSREARPEEPAKANEYGEDRDEEEGPGILEVICQGKGEKKGLVSPVGHFSQENQIESSRSEWGLRRMKLSLLCGIQCTDEDLLS